VKVDAYTSTGQLSLGNIVIVSHKCAYCGELERKLEGVLDELSSMKLVLKPLQEDSTQAKPCNSCGTNLQKDQESDDAVTTLQVAVNKDPVEEAGTQLLKTPMNISPKNCE
jgi:hypothetical protein